jgi:hypothetical protein
MPLPFPQDAIGRKVSERFALSTFEYMDTNRAYAGKIERRVVAFSLSVSGRRSVHVPGCGVSSGVSVPT